MQWRKNKINNRLMSLDFRSIFICLFILFCSKKKMFYILYVSEIIGWLLFVKKLKEQILKISNTQILIDVRSKISIKMFGFCLWFIQLVVHFFGIQIILFFFRIKNFCFVNPNNDSVGNWSFWSKIDILTKFASSGKLEILGQLFE